MSNLNDRFDVVIWQGERHAFDAKYAMISTVLFQLQLQL